MTTVVGQAIGKQVPLSTVNPFLRQLPIMTPPAQSHITIEACVSSVEEAVAAVRAGAARIELCGALELGGLTPSFALIQRCIEAVQVPVVVMLRPRAGGFCYSEDERLTMQADARLAIQAGAAGVVFGMLDSCGRVDPQACAPLLNIARDVQTVFHRAIDFVEEPNLAIATLVELGFTRVLTSGGESNAIVGAVNIAQWQRMHGHQIEILPGGGIKSENVVELLRLTGCRQVHVSASQIQHDPSLDTYVKRHSKPIQLNDLVAAQGTGFRQLHPTLMRQIAERIGSFRED